MTDTASAFTPEGYGKPGTIWPGMEVIDAVLPGVAVAGWRRDR